MYVQVPSTYTYNSVVVDLMAFRRQQGQSCQDQQRVLGGWADRHAMAIANDSLGGEPSAAHDDFKDGRDVCWPFRWSFCPLVNCPVPDELGPWVVKGAEGELCAAFSVRMTSSLAVYE